MTFPSQQSKKTKWTADEDARLRRAVQSFGTDSWNNIAAFVPSRTGKQCRERWIGQLAPSVSRENWTPNEDAALSHAHSMMGNRWTKIATQLPGRSGLQVKNRWNWLVRHGAFPPRLPDVLERKAATVVFEPITGDDGLFGSAFQEFRAKMLT
jgi:hypothetical protein